MIPAAFDYTRAASLDEAIRILGSTDGAKVLAGGQSLLPLLKLRLAGAGTLVDIGRLEELRGIRRAEDGSVAIGALVTYRELHDDTPFPWVREALAQIGDVQVRNVGTIGGAIAHADPASDFPAIALAYDATVLLRGPGGEREVPLDLFLEGPFVTGIRDDEILVEVRRPAAPANAGGAYVKLAQPASGYSIVGVAAIVARDGGSVSHTRVAITGVGPVAYRARAVEDALTGSDGSAQAIAAAAARATDGVEVNGDIHADRDYRAAMAVVHTRRAIETALSRAG